MEPGAQFGVSYRRDLSHRIKVTGRQQTASLPVAWGQTAMAGICFDSS